MVHKVDYFNSNELKLRELQELLLQSLAQDELPSDSRKNINPSKWGPSAWKFLDSVVAGYPKVASQLEKIKMNEFLSSMGYMLPCARCRESYELFSREYPIIANVNGRKEVKAWLKAYRRYQHKR